MRTKFIIYMGAAMLAGAIGSALLAPAPVGAVAREIIELQTSVNQLIQGQQMLQTTLTQETTIQKTLIEQTADSVNKLSSGMGSLQKSVQDLQATSDARLDSMSTQVQGVSDNLQEVLARMGKLNQQITDAQNAIQGLDAKISSSAPTATPGATPGGDPGAPGAPPAAGGNPPAAVAPPSADLLYSNGLRDVNGKKYDLATQEFQEYLKFYPDSDLASNAQYYLGEIAYAGEQYQDAVAQYSKVIDNYPKSFKLAPAHLKKGQALVAMGMKAAGIRELRLVVRLYPGTNEERLARTKLKEMGVSAAG